MKPKNLATIQQSFETQAPNFESNLLNFSKEDYLKYTISRINPQKEETVLEVAAGTCVCGRSLAPSVRSVVCLDATVAMMEIGRKAAQEDHLSNMTFIKGYAEDLPFLDNSYDIVFSRLAFHHFTAVESAFSEMVRVLKPGGKLVLIDMGAAKEDLRQVQDHIETMRDPSHVKNLSVPEMKALFEKHGLVVKESDTTPIAQNLQHWMNLTKPSEVIQEQIIQQMKVDINGGDKTGFDPYWKENELYFNQRWVLMIGVKPSA